MDLYTHNFARFKYQQLNQDMRSYGDHLHDRREVHRVFPELPIQAFIRNLLSTSFILITARRSGGSPPERAAVDAHLARRQSSYEANP